MTKGTWLARDTEAVNLEWQHTVCMYLRNNKFVKRAIRNFQDLVDCWKVLMSMMQSVLLFGPPVKSFSTKGTPCLQKESKPFPLATKLVFMLFMASLGEVLQEPPTKLQQRGKHRQVPPLLQAVCQPE